MDISAYRRAYFALVKTLALDDEARHDFNHAQTGKYSTGEFTVDDWRLVVSILQRMAGQNVAPGRPHIRGHGNEQGGMCTPAQLEQIVRMADQIAWKASPEQFVRSRLLSPLRKEIWTGRWEFLFRSEASAVIAAFRRMAAA
jgi:hypothetical protein